MISWPENTEVDFRVIEKDGERYSPIDGRRYRSDFEVALSDYRCKLYLTIDNYGRSIYLCKFHGPLDTIVKVFPTTDDGMLDAYGWLAAMSTNFPPTEEDK